MRKLIIVSIVGILLTAIVLGIMQSLPYSDSDELISADIKIDSIWTLGPTVGLLDKQTNKYYWFKSYTSFDQSGLDSLKSKHASIRYMKFLAGPLENRIYKMEVDSLVIFDQVIEK